MATSSLEICNIALLKIGADSITALSDANKRARLCTLLYDFMRKKLLRAHPWNFAIKRSFLQKVTDTSTSVNDGTDIFTSAAALNSVTGDTATVTLTSGTIPSGISEDSTYYIIKTGTSAFKLAETQASALADTAIDITANGVFNISLNIGAPFGYSQKFTLPTDYIRAVKEEDKNREWKKEGSFILSNDSDFNLEYIYNVTDTTTFDPSFDELLAHLIAIELAFPLNQSQTLKDRLLDEWKNFSLKDARSFDAQEGTPDDLETNLWLNSRL